MADAVLTIQHGNNLYYPLVLDSPTLTLERKGSPGQLRFTVLHDDGMKFEEGDVVRFYYGDKGIFLGFVFTKKHNKERQIEVMAYDQTRYLKNKYTYLFSNKTAAQIVNALCSDFGIKTGHVEDTYYTIPSLLCENKSLIDIILDALDETLMNTGEMYILYDNFGALELRHLADMVSNVLIDDETAENYTYSSSIDEETYNKIVLYYVDEETKVFMPYSAKDDTSIQKWGLLQYFEEVSNPSIGQNKADALLKLYNKKTRQLQINDAFGCVSVRAGSLIPVKLHTADGSINHYLLVEKVTHKFEDNHYTMDLILNGSWEN